MIIIKELSTHHAIIHKVDENGNVLGVGYDNSTIGREALVEEESNDTVQEVLAVWGTSPTVEDPPECKIPEEIIKSTEERIAELEGIIEMQAEVLDFLLMQ